MFSRISFPTHFHPAGAPVSIRTHRTPARRMNGLAPVVTNIAVEIR